MFNGIEHIISPMNAVWCGWVMFALLVLAILSEWFQPGIISQAHQSLVARTDRTYKEAPVNTTGQLLLSLFRIGTIAMGVCLCMQAQDVQSVISFCVVCVLVLSVLAVKMLCNMLLDYTFMLRRRFASPYEHYSNIVTLVTVALYPALLLLIHFGTPVLSRWVLAGAAVVFIALWFYRSSKIYVNSLMAAVYLVIYNCTLEVLPMAGLYGLSVKMLSIL